jgi:hypothetical protein
MYTLDLDQEFVNHLVIPESFQRIREEQLNPVVLEDELARKVYEYQLDHYREHQVIAGAPVLCDSFDELDIAVVQTAIDDLITRVRSRYARNEGRKAILDITQAHIHDPSSLAGELLEAGRRMHGILTKRGEIFSASDYDKAIQRYHKKVTAGRGSSMGFKELDEHFYGQKGLTFMVGAPKSYKSWFTVKALYENIMAGKHPFLYSLELPAEETDMRLRCLAAKVPYWKYLQNQLDKQDLQDLAESSEILSSFGSFNIEKPPSGNRGVANMVQRARDAGADTIFIDQLQYTENSRGVAVGATNDTKDYFEVINDFRDYSDDGPIWVVHQFNRSILNADEMPQMQQIKGSAAVEECATLALGLWSSKEMRNSNLVQVGTLTSRNYGHAAWQAQVKMRTTCWIELVGRVEDE